MKRHAIAVSLLFVCLVFLASGSNPRAFSQEPDTMPIPTGGGMLGWPVPDKPIPHHEPGHPAKTANYDTQVQVMNAAGVEETVQLTGLDALMADGVMDDPLQGNYRLVDLDKLMWSSYHDLNDLTLQTFKLVTPTLQVIPDSWAVMGDHRIYDTAAGDLNGDGQDEQIAAWFSPQSGPWPHNNNFLSIGEMPGSLGRVTSPPAVVSSTGALHLFVRGYDDALWHHDGVSWQVVGGRLLSGPAVASRAAGQFDVFAAGLDDSVEPNYLVVWHNQWNGASWTGWLALDNPDEGNPPSGWPTVEQNVPTPEFPAPAVVASGTNQLYLFWLWPDNTLRWRHFNGATWGLWQNLGGMLASGPGAVAHDGQIDVFANGVDGALWTRTYTSTWGSWQRVDRPGMPGGVTIASAPAAVSPAAGKISVTVRGSDGGLWQLTHDGTNWGNWNLAGLNKSASGQAGQALGLDGVDDYVDLPDNFPNVTEFTFAAWVYWNGGNAWQRIFDFGQDTNSNMFLTPSSDTTNMRFAITTGGAGKEKHLNASEPITQAQWVHVAVTLDGSQGTLYVNGSVADTEPITLTPHDVVGANTWLGKSQYAADPAFAGKIDEVAVFTRTLSAPEIASIASIYGPGWDSVSGKVLGLHLDENPATHGTTLTDMSGSGNDGTLYTFGNSKLASAPAVVARGGQIDVFARTGDGHLGHASYIGSTWTDWANFEGLNTGAVYETSSVSLSALAGNDALENLWLDVETGYFTGDGRQQIVLAYQVMDEEDGGPWILIDLYDIRDGFAPHKIAASPLITGTVPRITAADVDGDGTDEIGIAHLVDDQYHYKVEVYDVEIVGGSWTGNLVKLPNESPRFYSCDVGCNTPDDVHWFAGTLRITSGDFVKEAQGQNSNVAISTVITPNEEIAVLSDWVYRFCNPFYGCGPTDRPDFWVQLYILDNDYDTTITDCRLGTDSNCPIADMWSEQIYGEVFTDSMDVTGLGLGAGDVNGDRYDEIVLSWPVWFDHHNWPDLMRTLRVLDARNVNPIGPTQADRQPAIMAESDWIPGAPIYQWNSYLDTLAVGDLDRDLQDEIVFYQFDELQQFDELLFYEYKGVTDITGTLEWVSTIPSMSGTDPKVNLVMGDFTGESLRVGLPTYRLQNRVDSLEALINMPPKHRDLVKDAGGEYQLVEVLMEPCWDTPADPRCTHAKHGGKNGEVSEVETKVQRDWAIGGGLDAKISKGSFFADLSLKYSYGNHFTKTTTTINANTYNQYATAYEHDKIVYYGTPYQVWEYPVFGDNTAEPLDHITVLFPVAEPIGGGLYTPAPDTVTGDFPGEPMYSPHHQTYNVWSYDPIGTVRFPDYDPANLILEKTISGGGDWFEVNSGQTTAIVTTTALSHDFSSEVGLGYKGGAHIPFTSIKFGLEFRAYGKFSYAKKDIETDKLTTSEETMLSAGIAEQDIAESFTIRPIAYWANAGYLVLDYQTEMGDWGVWQQYYSKPDPAFVLPWYGFPDPNDPIPPASPELKLSSYDVQVTPPYAGAGDTVTISAAVRNFSNQLAQNVKVRFYQGYPAGTNLIGEATIPQLNRPDGPKTVSITWTASGVGDQKIYAVIDPTDAIDEVHDAGDLIDNNIAYGRLQIGAAAYSDMGLAQDYAYQSQSYTQTNSLIVSAYLPPGNLDEITLFELKDANLAVESVIGYPFELAADPGSLDWNAEEDFPLRPNVGDPPAVIAIAYDDADIAGVNEANLRLFRRSTYGGWQEATCGEAYTTVRFLEDNLITVPITQTGTFALSAETPVETWLIFLPLVLRNAP